MKEFYNIACFLNGIDGVDITIIYESGEKVIKPVPGIIPDNAIYWLNLHAKEMDLRHRHRKNNRYDSIDDMMLHQRILEDLKQFTYQPKKD